MILNIEELTNDNLETLNIIYDIFIDEERFTEIDVICKKEDIVANINKIIDENNEQPGFITSLLCMCENDKNLKIDKKYLSDRNISLWNYLFLTKKARAVLQSIGSTVALKLIDEVAEYLLSKLPLIYSEIKDDCLLKEYPVNFGRKKFLILFYNEISQCYLGYLNTGFAQKALKYYKPGKCCYELLGLYNKAIGLKHHENKRSREKALNYFDEIIDTFNDRKENLGYDYNIDISLWEMYVYFPAIFQKADVLIKLQRGKESIDILEQISAYTEEYPVPNYRILKFDYKKIDGMMLMIQAMIEASYSQIEIIKKIKILRTLLKNYKGPKNILSHKYLSLKAKTYIEKARMTPKNNKNYQSIYKDLSKSFIICKWLFKKEKNNEEKIQAANYWLEAYQIYFKIKKEIKTKLNLDEHLINIITFILDKIDNDDKLDKGDDFERWIPIKGEILNLLVKVLEGINNSKDMNNAISEKEKECCIQLINKKNKPSSYVKVKSNRRLLLLGKREEDIDKRYHFPSDIELIKNFVNSGINKDFYTQSLRYNTELFDGNLIYNSYWPQYTGKYAFTILRKWQSYTPSLSSYSTSSRGGGYFIYKVGEMGQIEEGIVIDPGYDFIENFIEYNFSIRDISAIALTHSHIDHSVDFRGLITLIHEMNKRGIKKQYDWPQIKITVVTTPSCFNHIFQVLIESRDCIKDVIVVDPDSQNKNETNKYNIGNYFNISAVPAYHKDLQEDANCVGLVLRDYNGDKLVGFTGDTVWTNTLSKNIDDCTVVCANMGAIFDVRKDDSFEKTFDDDNNIRKLIYKENHLYLPGIITLLEELRQSKKTKITIIGELGEELKSGLRKDLFHKLNEFIKDRNNAKHKNIFKMFYKYRCPRPLVAIEDIGLTITWERGEPFIRCIRCKKPVSPDKVMLYVMEDERKSEQLYYYCKECLDIVESLETGVEKHWQKRYLPPQQV